MSINVCTVVSDVYIFIMKFRCTRLSFDSCLSRISLNIMRSVFDYDSRLFKLCNFMTNCYKHITIMTLKNNTPVTDGMTEFDFWSRHCAAGGMSAAVSKTVSAPLDRIRMHMQITDVGGFRAAVRHVYNKQGVRGFWRGNGLSMLKSSPEFAIKFSMYDFTKRQLKASRNDGRLNARDRFVAGAVAGVFSQTFLYPLDTVKTRLIVGKYTNFMDVVVKTYKNGGAWAFFKGFWPSTLSIFLFTGIELMTYEHIKENYSHYCEKDDYLRLIVNFYSAFISSTVGVMICYPISTVITRLQVNDGCSRGTMVVSEKCSRRRPLSANVLCSGLQLYRGISGSIVKILPTTSIGYVIYEELCKSFGVRMS
ncbi:calcium-binding mitochondrial carrier protein SCaMC-1-like isoform X2 [Aphis gossypii]|uniref:calcium-binding mitochondrial carrier protein SCaMC-1-like isoform X2 n=1 Tax=Aphis gossypii TaxID=80765 RepID=UPI0021591CB5|nr:calcium-binding mitochondrial carrier protein SCaMC-1-like isoform X2 [Aphis gossypii]